jgi:hypothetical protein
MQKHGGRTHHKHHYARGGRTRHHYDEGGEVDEAEATPLPPNPFEEMGGGTKGGRKGKPKPIKPTPVPANEYKHGGRHPDEAEDRAMIKHMVKGSALKKYARGGREPVIGKLVPIHAHEETHMPHRPGGLGRTKRADIESGPIKGGHPMAGHVKHGGGESGIGRLEKVHTGRKG